MPRAAGRKRTRSLLDAVASVDDLLNVTSPLRSHGKTDGNSHSDVENDDRDLSEHDEVSGVSASPCVDGPGWTTASTVQNHHHNHQPSALAADSPPSAPLDSFVFQNSGSLGGTEMALLNRQDEELADMAVFLARTLRRVGTIASLHALVQHFAVHGARRVLMALKHAGTQSQLFQTLCDAHGSKPVQARVMRLVGALFAESDHEVFYCEPVVRFLVQCMKDDGGDDADKPREDQVGAEAGGVVGPPPKPVAAHWSSTSVRRAPKTSGGSAVASPARKTPSPPSSPHAADTTSAVADVDTLLTQLTATSAATESPLPLSRQALGLVLALLLEQNQHRVVVSTRGGVESVARLFRTLGGVEVVCGWLEKSGDGEAASAALSLLEVLTVSGCGGRGAGRDDGDGAQLSPLAVSVVRLLRQRSPLPNASTSWTVVNACLRVLTNVTNLDATVLRGPLYRRDEQWLAHWLSGLLCRTEPAAGPTTTTTEWEESVTFALCCAVNLAKYEARHVFSAEASFTAALVWSSATSSTPTSLAEGVPMPLLTALATRMFGCYVAEETTQIVLSGYYALLLGVLSLVRDDPDDVLAVVAPLNLRVRVLTAVADAARDSPVGTLAEGSPLTLVVVILQEFLLFQSSSGTLTRDGLVALAGVVEQLVAVNGIEVAHC